MRGPNFKREETINASLPGIEPGRARIAAVALRQAGRLGALKAGAFFKCNPPS